MAENGNGNGDGQRDRATVALVDAKVDGLRELIRAEFATVKEDVKALAAITSDVIKQGVKLDDHERRLTKIENDKDADRESAREYRRVNLPTIILTGVATVIALAALLIQVLLNG